MHWRRKWQPTPVFLPWESQGWGSLVGCRLWSSTESDTTWSNLAAAAAIYFRLWTLHLFFQTFSFVLRYSQLAMFIYFHQPISLHFQILWDLLNISSVGDNSILCNYIVFIDYSFLHNCTFPTEDSWRDGQKIHEPTSQSRSSISMWFWK